ncbi:aquaporin-like protein [Hortaea werneckii]|nr:aquaporin-like protein [Hortaea werneckii]
MSHDQNDVLPMTLSEKPSSSDDMAIMRPSDDSQNDLLPPKPLEPRAAPAAPAQYEFRSDRERSVSQAPPRRHPSRQVMRWAPPPPPSEYIWDDERQPYRARTSLDYSGVERGVPVGPPSDYYYQDFYHEPYYGRRYRPQMSSQPPPTLPDGPPGPPPPPPRRPLRSAWEDSSDDEDAAAAVSRKKRENTARSMTPPEEILRLPFTMWMNSNAKNHFVATIAEFVGTTMFLFFAFAGTQVANAGAKNSSNTTTNAANGFSPNVLAYIALSFGFSLMVNVWIFFRVSGGLFNPAVTFAMIMIRNMNLIRGFLLLGAQLAGAIFSAYIVSILFPTQFNVRTTLSAETSRVQGVFIEALLTAELVFTIFMLAKEKHRATFMAPVGIGLALFVSELIGVYYTGGSLNPARSFGPCVVSGVFDSEHWIYWVGPGLGAIIAVVFYKFIKILQYEVANPGQDEASDELAEKAAASPKKDEKSLKEERQQQAMANPMGDVSEYFDSKTMSDVTVVFATEHGTCSISAHKIVLAQSSDFFKRAFIGSFKVREASSTEIRLHDDNPFALFSLLAYCYGLRFDGRSEYSKTDIAIECNDHGAAYVQHQVDVYVVADKYGVGNLCTDILTKLPAMLGRITSSSHSAARYPAHLDQVARHFYLVHPVAAKQLRKPVVAMFAKHVKSWVGTEEFERLVLDLPEFAVELFRALAGDGAKQGTAAGGAKAKRGQKRGVCG